MKTALVSLTCSLLLLGAMSGSAFTQTPAAANFKTAANGQIYFVMPSKNIGCTFTPQGGTQVYEPFDGGPELSCDRIEPKYVRVVLTPKNIRRFNDVGDQDCCGEENVFAHGTRWSQGPFTCDSEKAGLSCKRADGKGFFMSRADIKLQ
jgi:hypothetical protein